MSDKDKKIKKPSKSRIRSNVANSVHRHDMGLFFIKMLESVLSQEEKDDLINNDHAEEVYSLINNSHGGQQPEDDDGDVSSTTQG